jgi:hypothetical protein
MDDPLVKALAPELFALVQLRYSARTDYSTQPWIHAEWERAARQILDHLGAIDVVLPDGTHRYYSTHCRHGRHEDCSATFMTGITPRSGRAMPRAVGIERKPAQCKTCAAPCMCSCHQEAERD